MCAQMMELIDERSGWDCEWSANDIKYSEFKGKRKQFISEAWNLQRACWIGNLKVKGKLKREIKIKKNQTIDVGAMSK